MAEYTRDQLDRFVRIGQKLKAVREARNRTLQEISAQTRINLAFLEKIEKGDLPALPGLAFVKGFIRNYVQALELEDEELNADVRALGGGQEEPIETHISATTIKLLDTESPRTPYLKMAIYAVLLVLILWVGYLVFGGSKEPEPVARNEPAAQTPPATEEAAAPPTAPAAPETLPAQTEPPPATTPAKEADKASETPQTTAPPAAENPPAAPPPPAVAATPREPPRRAGALEGRQKLELTIRGLERTWIRLSIDRAPPIDVLMEPAETVGWEANQEIRLTIGKSHGVAVYLNGEEIILPGESNRLIPTLVLDKLTLLRLEN